MSPQKPRHEQQTFRIVPPIRVRRRVSHEEALEESLRKAREHEERIIDWINHFSEGGPGHKQGLKESLAIWIKGRRTESALWWAAQAFGWDCYDLPGFQTKLLEFEKENTA